MSPARYYLTNRALEVSGDGWIHIVPKGELPNEEAGIVQVLDDAALDSIEQNLERDRAALGERWPGLYVGREHFVYDSDQDSAALGWLKDFQRRPDGLWANAAGLTPAGRQAVANAEYKFTSFVADRKATQPLDGKRHRILRVDTIGFTNQANGKELLTPITNRQTDAPSSSAPALTPAPARVQTFRPAGLAVYDVVATLVANRLKRETGGFERAHAIVAVRNRDLVEPGYHTDVIAGTRHFSHLVNRAAHCGGLSPVRATNRSADDAAALCQRFAPALLGRPAAVQFDALWRAAEALSEAGLPDRLCNRTAPDEVTKSDWKTANGRAADVLALLDAEANNPVDRGHMLQNAPACQVRGVFRRAIERLMREKGMTRSRAFESLKADEPIFWTLAMLSFEPAK